MKVVIDLDGTICSEEKQFSRAMAKPIEGARDFLLKLRSRGDVIIIYTSRGWAEYEMTFDWLTRFEIPFDQLILGNPQGDVWIDDRDIEFSDWETIGNRIL